MVGVFAVLLMLCGFISAYIGYQDMKNNDFYTKIEVNNLLKEQEGTFKSEIQGVNHQWNEVLSKFKVCIVMRGLGACIYD